MEKKSVAASILVIFMAITFSVIGICFSMFVFTYTKIEVKSVAVSFSGGVEVFDDKELSKKTTTLSLSNMDTGLKPATGELDAETKIPSSITDTGTSEGYYATVYVKSTVAFKVTIKDISVKSNKNEFDVLEERKNLFFAIKDVKNSVKSLEKSNIEVATFENVNGSQKLTFMIWLGSLSTGDLEGAEISFTIDFVPV